MILFSVSAPNRAIKPFQFETFSKSFPRLNVEIRIQLRSNDYDRVRRAAKKIGRKPAMAESEER